MDFNMEEIVIQKKRSPQELLFIIITTHITLNYRMGLYSTNASIAS